jgi:hypothetical protein
MPHEFEARDADVRSTQFPALVRANGSAYPVTGYAFDGTAIEAIYFRFRASDYTSGDVAVTLDWYADFGTTGAVTWGAQMAAITQDADTQDIETDTLPTTSNTVTTHLGTTAQRLHRTTITLTGASLDSIATGDYVTLKIQRVATDAGDTMTADAILVHVGVAA